jgi:hypothetical protein
MEAARIRVNAPQVIHESIDGEVIIINLTSGNYYSVTGSGADVWSLIEQSSGVTRADLTAALEPRFEASQAEIDGLLESFLSDLRTEGLVTDADPSGDPPVFAAPPEGAGARPPFAAPRLEKYTDMQDLVLLDPVHEVDATGWPAREPDPAVNNQSA